METMTKKRGRGRPRKPGNRKPVMLVLDVELHQRVKARAAKEARPMVDVVESALREYLGRHRR